MEAIGSSEAAIRDRALETALVPLDFVDAEGALRTLETPDPHDPDAQFRVGWIRSLFIEAVARLQDEYRAVGKERAYDVFERYDLTDYDPAERMTYAEVGRELGLTTTQVNNALAAARRRLRDIILEQLRAMCASKAEFRAEARDLFGQESV